MAWSIQYDPDRVLRMISGMSTKCVELEDGIITVYHMEDGQIIHADPYSGEEPPRVPVEDMRRLIMQYDALMERRDGKGA